MSAGTYTLFDIPTKAPQVCWSMNTWRSKSTPSELCINPLIRRLVLKRYKARILLNYKGLNYKTEWVEYPHIAPRLNQHVPPNENGAAFTLPAIQLPDGSYMMDSYKIADIIEEKHPVPSLPLNRPLQLRFRKILIEFMGQLTPIYVPGVAQRLLSDESLEFFHSTRQKDVGMPLDEYREKHAPGAFERAEPSAREMTALLTETSGPYFLGDIVSYTDFIWAAILLFWKTLGDDTYQEVLRISGDAEAHTKFLDALSPWTKRNN